MSELTRWVFTELAEHDSIFGIPRSAFFVPDPGHKFRTTSYGQPLDGPFGVAAGPHTQMAQNIIMAWLSGARFIELKTVQTLDELDVPKPCIDCQDEGYNVEWSQELKVHESFDEYLRAWVLIHALHRYLGFPADRPAVEFNMSVGYDLQGILQPNVQWYLDKMADASPYLDEYVDIVAAFYPEVRDIEIPSRISDTITLSTMHGCPPDEIERISEYLLSERKLHTNVKCNPTLLGPERVRTILHDDLGYVDVPVPDAAFEHDLKYEDAVPMFHNLKRVAKAEGLQFGVKLSNTLEVLNFRDVFGEETMYMSGRALHAITTNLALRLNEDFRGNLLMSFAGGADCFNVPHLLASGMATITVCSDLLKSGGYLRLLQYFETTSDAIEKVSAIDLPDYIAKTGISSGHTGFAEILAYNLLADTDLAFDQTACADLEGRLSVDEPVADVVRRWAGEQGLTAAQTEVLFGEVVKTYARLNLRAYAAHTRQAWELRKDSFQTSRSKTDRALGLFDCIAAPCEDECPVNQRVPEYMRAVREGDWERAVAVTRQDNPIPTILGRVCDHLCEHTCIRTHYDQPLAIRDMKRFIMEHEDDPALVPQAPPNGIRVAIIGAGPAGIAAAEKLAMAGFAVTIFEREDYAGGMVAGAIPTYRIPDEAIEHDLKGLEELGVEIRYGTAAGRDFNVDDLRRQGYRYVVVAIGAQISKTLGLEGEDADGVVDALHFLRSVREGHPIPVGPKVVVIGAGDTAMDCARSAWRLGAEVTLAYRRTIDQMPADREEVHALMEEGIEVVELVSPVGLHVEDGKLVGIRFRRNEYRGDRDSSGRKIPHEVPDSDFELPADTMIVAISQHALIDFFGDEMPMLTKGGYLKTDPRTLQTSLPGVYAGGDVAEHGPASIVKAAADGKRIATSILREEGIGVEEAPRQVPDVDIPDLIRRKAHREFRIPIGHRPVEERRNFLETTYPYTPEAAQAEAARCLDCDAYCSICVGVCPNAALMTYETEPIRLAVPEVSRQTGQQVGVAGFDVDQTHQIAVLTDFCNECGNCVTFCPTAGEPYRDKPRLYLHRGDFLDQHDNAFMRFADRIEGRFGGETHVLEWGDRLKYRSPGVTAELAADTFELLAFEATPGAGTVTLVEAATLLAIGRGLASMPHLPVSDGEGRGRVPAPA